MAKLLNSPSNILEDLHQPHSPVVFTNIHDAASAKAIVSLPSAKALATAGHAVAAAAGLGDDDLTMEINIAAATRIASVIKDFQKPLQLLQVGVAGTNLEDYNNTTKKMYSLDEAASRIRRVMDVAQSAGVADFVVNARFDTFLHRGELEEVIQRGQRYLAAGATTAFDGRLNVLLKLSPDGLTIPELADIGVARISIGLTLQLKAMEKLKEEAENILKK
ncbi:phosphoenolpyruvate phosphomutase-domain-containing protein [Fusarium redolens]|uniref:Phosphoenolpyruvate phosphomutase-domain-containing protein n=1 Tax=Fusarium redolens TaxID=48865 RepID=A0A9P9G3F1_FUSRE|nr:phosphoenolpyruvate phosphomutase-domain-containing protein [Fusarium redolens]KAH7232405.1 phosphoenolpyruvate phosphomutase-domain-containing protein [Fusarium redolens]